ncbi:unnamed protein product [Paramecium octaurelia]|uniref:Uncharacterized protein n=1 Tax=Paramecium octaurelia TaxID=43137 RepID=A0A8S1XVH0_PAROT|nr:unnamed protein product [Paramecium octaurelia]
MENQEYNKELHYQKQVRTLKLPLKPNLKVLDVSGLKLKDLSFLADQQDIEILIAESNELTNQCFKEIAHLKKLKILSLQDNQIVDDANMKLLADANLLELRLLFNPICQTQQYYKLIYKALPNLYTLDDYDQDGLQIHSLF